MRRPDRLGRWGALRRLVLWLSLALLGACAQAAPRAMQEANANSAAAMDARKMPAFADCMPCPGCYLAPAPPGFSGEGKEPEELVWRVPAASLPDADDWIGLCLVGDRGGRARGDRVRLLAPASAIEARRQGLSSSRQAA